MDIGQINIWIVLLAALAKFILGSLWYSPMLFGKIWLQEIEPSKDPKVSTNTPLLISAGFGLIAAFTLAVIITLLDLDFIRSVALGSLIGIGITSALLGPQLIYEGRSFRLFAVYAGQNIAELILMAAIIGGWR